MWSTKWSSKKKGIRSLMDGIRIRLSQNLDPKKIKRKLLRRILILQVFLKHINKELKIWNKNLEKKWKSYIVAKVLRSLRESSIRTLISYWGVIWMCLLLFIHGWHLYYNNKKKLMIRRPQFKTFHNRGILILL